MDYNERFNKIWNENVKEYETIPDKTKISNEDKEFVRGYYFCLDNLANVIENYKDTINNSIDTFDKLELDIVRKYDKYTKDFLLDDMYELITSILDSYVE